jgi:hypothetical protein
MALWAGTSLNTNELASVVNQIFGVKGISMVTKRNGLLYKVLGKQTMTEGKYGPEVKFERLNKITGKAVEVPLIGASRTISTVANGSGEFDSITPSYDADAFGAFEVKLAHYADSQGIPGSEYERFKGKEAKTLDYIGDRIMPYLIESWRKTLGTSVNQETNAPSDQYLGSWEYMVDASNTYGLDRSDAANAAFRGKVNASVGTLTLATIDDYQNQIMEEDGFPDIGVCSRAVYGYLRQLVQPYSQVEYDEDMAKFGSPYVGYAKTVFCLDAYTNSGTLGLLDSSTFAMWMHESGLSTDGILKDVTKKHAYVLHWTAWAQFLCMEPRKNAKLQGITD